MPEKRKASQTRGDARPQSLQQQVDSIVATLRRMGSKSGRDSMARFAIPTDRAFGISMAAIQKLAKQTGRNHELALDLWETGWYEARTLAIFIAEPERLTAARMDAWCRDFDSWAICDGACFHLFDRTPHAFRKVNRWAKRREEFIKRAAFALIASLALHDKAAPDDAFLDCLPLIEKAATDERNFVKKGVSWALRGIGARNRQLHAAALELARRLAASSDSTTRWIGKDAIRDLTRPLVMKRISRRATS